MPDCKCLNGKCNCTRKNTFDWVLLIIIGVLVVLALFLVILLWTRTPKCTPIESRIKYQRVVVYQPVEIQPSETLKANIPESKLVYLPKIPEPVIFNDDLISEADSIPERGFDTRVDQTIDNSLNVPDFDIISESPVVQKSFVTTIPNIPTVSLDNLANVSVASARSIPTKSIKINKNSDVIKGF